MMTNKRSVKLNFEIALPMKDNYCDGCPALGEKFCNQLQTPLKFEELTGKSDRILCKRHYQCPFNTPTCPVCKNDLELKQLGNDFIIEHQCFPTIDAQIIATGNDFESTVSAFNNLIIKIRNAFKR